MADAHQSGSPSRQLSAATIPTDTDCTAAEIAFLAHGWIPATYKMGV